MFNIFIGIISIIISVVVFGIVADLFSVSSDEDFDEDDLPYSYLWKKGER